MKKTGSASNQQPIEMRAALRTIAMPADTNSNGDIFGGWLLSQMDLAGSIIAAETSQSRIATVGVEAMTFHRPVYVGDEVTCYAEIFKIGTTSIAIQIETWARRIRENRSVKVTEGRFTYVAIGENRTPIPVIRSKKAE